MSQLFAIAAGLTRLQALHQVINEEREDPFQDITLSDQEEANDEVNVVDNDEYGDEDGEVE